MRIIRGTLLPMLCVATLAVLSGASYESLERGRAQRTFSVPGRLVDVGGGRRIQLDCRGHGSPTVVLESGLDTYGSLAWAAVHDSIALTTRVCAYSRAGIMWSDAAAKLWTSGDAALDLHAALAAGGETGPWIIVAHSLGGPYTMIFTKMYPADVAGLVFVDASHPDQFVRFREATGKMLLPSPTMVHIGAAVAWSGLVRLMPSPPMSVAWPEPIRLVTPSFVPVSVRALAREIEGIPATLEAAAGLHSLDARPLVVLTAGRSKSDVELREMSLTPAQGERLAAASRALQNDLATWSRRSRHEVVPDASHYIQFDRPGVVINAVREVVSTVRAISP
jgi:pimeloyl-ACP methyl ester carboxylesterase